MARAANEATTLTRGEIWMFGFQPPDQQRPVLVLTRPDMIGVLNTVVLLVSSFMMVMAVHSARLGRQRQLVLYLLLTAGLFTRVNALLLAAILGGAVLQNLLAGRDPQLAILYTLILLCLAIWGSGRFSLDAMLSSRIGSKGNTEEELNK